ncbi:BioY family transporter [Subtercola sp. Z020]|uniref:biotin transporter BioY n=1 Tax=Subtercola sp. Z020 TaxID=2080582 RepID=UPI000CE89C03|nr:biotin transporter BioY [Subtercola sp. Z020]PPF80320.1 BioY family transporter [Subtercola sp. Z020]
MIDDVTTPAPPPRASRAPRPPRAPRPARIDATDVARIAVFAAIVAVLGLPGGFAVFGSVPITAQTLGVMLAGAILGAWRGALSLLVFLALVALGLPLLAGGHGGLGVFVGPTAGYLVGWVAGAFVVGLIVHGLSGSGRLRSGESVGASSASSASSTIRNSRRTPTAFRTVVGVLVGGILVIYAFGIPVQAAVLRLALDQVALQSLVFVPGDLVKAAIAVAIVLTLLRAYPSAFRAAGRPRREQERTPARNQERTQERTQDSSQKPEQQGRA